MDKTTAAAVTALLRTLALVLREHPCLPDREQDPCWTSGTAERVERVADALAAAFSGDSEAATTLSRYLAFLREDLAGYIDLQRTALTTYLA